MILVINNSRDLYKATMAPKLLGILRALNIEYIIIEKKKN